MDRNWSEFIARIAQDSRDRERGDKWGKYLTGVLLTAFVVACIGLVAQSMGWIPR